MGIALFLLGHAFADYPSPLPKDATSYYQSLGMYTWNSYRGIGEERYLPDDERVSGGISTTALGRGLTDRVDIQLILPLRYASLTNHEPVVGFGQIELASKVMLIQEGLAPLTMSLRPAIRIGSLHAQARGEIHNIGEGSLDTGIGIALGRFSFLDTGFYWFDMGVRYWHRIPASFDMTDPPFPEISYDINVGFTSNSIFGFGVSAAGLQRLGGNDFPDLDGVSDIDKWASLRAVQLKAGIKGFYYLSEKITIDLTTMGTVFAQNNPLNEVFVGIGINYFVPPSR